MWPSGFKSSLLGGTIAFYRLDFKREKLFFTTYKKEIEIIPERRCKKHVFLLVLGVIMGTTLMSLLPYLRKAIIKETGTKV